MGHVNPQHKLVGITTASSKKTCDTRIKFSEMKIDLLDAVSMILTLFWPKFVYSICSLIYINKSIFR